MVELQEIFEISYGNKLDLNKITYAEDEEKGLALFQELARIMVSQQ